MKKFFKILVLMIVIIPCAFFCTGCLSNDDNKIVSIEQTGYTDENVSYKITYKDGSTFSYVLPIIDTENKIVSIEQTHFDADKASYKITYEDGRTFKYDLPINDAVSISSVSFSHSEGVKDYYNINYSNGDKTQFTVTNGEGGASLEDMYNEANKEGKYTNILEFIEDYLTFNPDCTSSTVAVGKAIRSAVSIYAFNPVSGPQYQYQYGSEKYYSWSAGSGVIYQLDKDKGDAYIITNCHVVYSANNAMGTDYATEVYCYLYGQESGYYLEEEGEDYVYDANGYPVINAGQYGIKCEIIGASTTYDIAVLKVTNSEVLKNSNALQVEVENSDNVILAEPAIAIGNPDAEGISVTQGIVSVLSEYIQVQISQELSTLREFRIDTAVNGGNSGGGLFNDKGELIGIVNAKTSDNTLENFGYAIPSNIATNVADNMIANYSQDYQGVKKVVLGITLDVKSSKTEYNTTTLTTDIIEEVVVHEVVENSIAEDGLKIKVGDIIKTVSIFDGTNTTVYNITRYHQVVDLMLKLRTGYTLSLACTSEGQPVVYSYTILAEDLTEVM